MTDSLTWQLPTSNEGFAELHIVSACDVITELPATHVTTEGNRRALCNFLGQAIRALQKNQTATAIDKIEKSVERTDGCELREGPDGNGPGRDWIIDCDAQAELFVHLSAALGALVP